MGLSLYLMRPEFVTGWSYSGFHLFRSRLAKEVDIDLGRMDGFSSDQDAKAWPGRDAIEPLLKHADNEGVLDSEKCRAIAPRLRELVARWPEDDIDRECGEVLADAMDEAAESGGEISFQ